MTPLQRETFYKKMKQRNENYRQFRKSPDFKKSKKREWPITINFLCEITSPVLMQ